MITKIVSGGQTGADRGGLDAAVYCHVPHGGWCPKGRLAEDGTIPLAYNLQEMRSKDYLKRTEQNVIDSDCTLVFTYGPPSRGTKRTIEFTARHGKSCHVVDLAALDGDQAVEGIVAWLNGQIEEHEFPAPPRHPVLNVAGPRESNVPGIADKVCAIVVQVLIRTNPDCRRHYPMTAPDPGPSVLPEVAELIADPQSDTDLVGRWQLEALAEFHGSTSQILEAALFAARKHAGQTRKDGQTPYINHPLEVAEILSRVGGVSDPDMLAAALLHDTLEDTACTREELMGEFGKQVTWLVGELTEDKSMGKAERKRWWIEHAPLLTAKAKQIKLADLISNVGSLAKHPPEGWSGERKRGYLKWAREVGRGCSGTNPALESELACRLEEVGRALTPPMISVGSDDLMVEADSGLSDEQARQIHQAALSALGDRDGQPAEIAWIKGEYEGGNVYGYREPDEPCWFVLLTDTEGAPKVGGGHPVVAVSRAGLRVVRVWWENGE